MPEPIRRAGAEDADVVARLLRDFNAEYEDPVPPQEEMAERIRVLLAHGDTVILLAGEPACALSVTRFRPGLWSPNLESYLAELYVVPDRRGQGIGRALMEETMAAARAAGADTMGSGPARTTSPHAPCTRASGLTTTSMGPEVRGRSASSTSASCRRYPSALRNRAMIGPSSGPPLTPPLSWTTMAKATSPGSPSARRRA